MIVSTNKLIAQLSEIPHVSAREGSSACMGSCVVSLPDDISEITARDIKRFKPAYIPEVAYLLGIDAMKEDIQNALIEHCAADRMHLLARWLGRLDRAQVNRIYRRSANRSRHLLDIDNPLHQLRYGWYQKSSFALNYIRDMTQKVLPGSAVERYYGSCGHNAVPEGIKVDTLIALHRRYILPESAVIRAIDVTPPERQTELLLVIRNLNNTMALLIAQRTNNAKVLLALAQNKLGRTMDNRIVHTLLQRFPEDALEIYSTLAKEHKTIDATRLMVTSAIATRATLIGTAPLLMFVMNMIPKDQLKDDALIPVLAGWIHQVRWLNSYIMKNPEILSIVNLYAQQNPRYTFMTDSQDSKSDVFQEELSDEEQTVLTLQALSQNAQDIYISLPERERSVIVTRECLRILNEHYDPESDYEDRIGPFLEAVPRSVLFDHEVRNQLKGYLERVMGDNPRIMRSRSVRIAYYLYLVKDYSGPR